MGRTEFSKRGTTLSRLTDKQRKFVQCYPKTLDGKKAAIEAGYSPNTAATQGAKLLKDPRVKRAVGKLLQEVEFGDKLTIENVLRELSYCVFRDPADLCDASGRINIDDLRKLPPEIRRCIDGIKCKTYIDEDGETIQEVELKFVQKGAMIRLAMDYFNLLQPTVQNQVFIDWDSKLNETLQATSPTEKE